MLFLLYCIIFLWYACESVVAMRQGPVKRLPTMRKLKSEELKIEERERTQRLLSFIDASPEPFHVVDTTIKQLKSAGFVRINEEDSWKKRLQPGGKYYFTRNGSSIIAFVIGGLFVPGNGYKLIGTHVDSPTLKIKPRSKRSASSGLLQLNVETYGGGLWNTWFDRDLSIAGRVLVQNKDKSTFEYKLVKIVRPVLRIPSLCIHLRTPEEREAFKVNKEDHLVPILTEEVTEKLTQSQGEEEHESNQWASEQQPELLTLLANELKCDVLDIADFELSLYDVQPAAVGGMHDEFVCSSRLDNLASTFVALEAIQDYGSSLAVSEDTDVSVVACFDHEEVGSVSNPGAGSTVIRDAVSRIAGAFSEDGGEDCFKRGLGKSFAISMDMAHAIHPNFAAKHEKSHAPRMNSGVVIKQNSNQRYATSGLTGFLAREMARRCGVPIQEFVVRNDCSCGSTIGPTISAVVGIRCVDLGMPMLSMHSLREMSGASDLTFAKKLFDFFYSPEWRKLDSQLVVDSERHN